MELKICHMYPEILNLYGDRGNILCMSRRLQWRGIDCSISRLPLGDRAKLGDFDIIFIGGGQDFDQKLLTEDLNRGKKQELKAAAEDGVSFLTVCGGFQLLGRSYKTYNGKEIEFTGILDMYTEGAKERMTGDYKFRCEPSASGSVVVGFENHSGRTWLGSGLQPLGKVLAGHGNNGEDGTEGAHWKNVYGTYSHGPVLPKNPEFCDHILRCALERRYGRAELAPLDDEAERLAHDSMCSRL